MKEYKEKDKSLKAPKPALEQKNNGSMDYVSKTDKMAKENAIKIKNIHYKESRYN